MKKTLKIAVCMLTCIAWLGASPASGQTAGAESKKPEVKVLQEFAAIELPETSFDFGEILEGTEVKHDFLVKNTGTSPLQVRNVVTNCDCIKTEYDSEVAPGKQGKISVKVDSRGYGGAFLKFINVSSNDPIRPQLRLNLKGMVQPLVTLEPGNLISFDGVAGRMVAKTVDLKSTTVKVFRITRMETDLKDAISYKLEPVAEGKHYRLTVENKLAEGIYDGFIKLVTDLPEKPEIKIVVKGKIKPIIAILPPRVLLGKMPSEKQERVAEVQVRNNLDKPFKITKLSFDDKLIKVDKKTLPNDAGYSLLLRAQLADLKAREDKSNVSDQQEKSKPGQPAKSSAAAQKAKGSPPVQQEKSGMKAQMEGKPVLDRKQTLLTIQTDADPEKTYEVRVEIVYQK